MRWSEKPKILVQFQVTPLIVFRAKLGHYCNNKGDRYVAYLKPHILLRSRAVVACLPHKQKVAGSIPASATTLESWLSGLKRWS